MKCLDFFPEFFAGFGKFSNYLTKFCYILQFFAKIRQNFIKFEQKNGNNCWKKCGIRDENQKSRKNVERFFAEILESERCKGTYNL